MFWPRYTAGEQSHFVAFRIRNNDNRMNLRKYKKSGDEINKKIHVVRDEFLRLENINE